MEILELIIKINVFVFKNLFDLFFPAGGNIAVVKRPRVFRKRGQFGNKCSAGGMIADDQKRLSRFFL